VTAVTALSDATRSGAPPENDNPDPGPAVMLSVWVPKESPAVDAKIDGWPAT